MLAARGDTVLYLNPTFSMLHCPSSHSRQSVFTRRWHKKRSKNPDHACDLEDTTFSAGEKSNALCSIRGLGEPIAQERVSGKLPATARIPSGWVSIREHAGRASNPNRATAEPRPIFDTEPSIIQPDVRCLRNSGRFRLRRAPVFRSGS